MAAVGFVRFAVAVAVLALLAGAASAQTSIFGLKLDGELELGGRVFVGDEPSKEALAVIEPYRDLSEQPFGAFRLRLSRPDESYATEMGGNKIGQDDQEFFLSTGRAGAWKFDFEWNQVPHFFAIDARSRATEGPSGVFTLPTPRPSLFSYNTAPELDQLSLRWDIARFSFTLTPAPDFDLGLEYTRIKKHGERPFSVAFGSPGNNFLEVLQPIDQTIHDFRIRGSWSGSWWQLQAGYTLSVFHNGEDAVQADNPCFGRPAAITAGGCAADATGAPSRGQVSVDPDNMAHTVTLAGAVNLPLRTRIAASASYTLRLQDESFLPHTINPAIKSPLLTLPAQSLDGTVGTFLFNLTATSRPLPPLTLTARYRLFDFDDMTDQLVFPGHVVNARTLVNEPRRAVRFGYTKQNAGLDARWRFGLPLALTIGGGWERWDREDTREVPTSDEYFAKAAVDATPWDWLLVRLTYRPSFRRISEYNTFAHHEHTVVEEDTPTAQAQGQSVLLRKFDEADRNRQRVDLILQITPTDVITVTPMVTYLYDDYVDSKLGLLKGEYWSAGVDVSWSPVERVFIGAGYVYERSDQKMRSRSRDVVGTTTFDFPDFDWISDNVDTVQTVYVGLKAALIPKVLDWDLTFNYQHGTGEINTRNPLKPTSGTAAQQVGATAKPFPEFVQSLYRLEAALRYRFWKNWTASLGYIFDKFTNKDFRTNDLTPFVSGVTSIWLGNTPKEDTAHIVFATLGYRFQ